MMFELDVVFVMNRQTLGVGNEYYQYCLQMILITSFICLDSICLLCKYDFGQPNCTTPILQFIT